MYNMYIKKVLERLISYFWENGINAREDGVFNINLCGSDISSLEEIKYLLAVEEIGDLICSVCNNLRDLRGSPREVSGDFYCVWCENLKSLEGCPSYIGGNFCCDGCNKLRSLGSNIKVIKGDFDCSDCDKLKEIKFEIDEIGKNLNCMWCKDLKYIDERVIERVGGKVYVYNSNNIKNKEEIVKKFGDKIEEEYVELWDIYVSLQ